MKETKNRFWALCQNHEHRVSVVDNNVQLFGLWLQYTNIDSKFLRVITYIKGEIMTLGAFKYPISLILTFTSAPFSTSWKLWLLRKCFQISGDFHTKCQPSLVLLRAQRRIFWPLYRIDQYKHFLCNHTLIFCNTVCTGTLFVWLNDWFKFF